MFHSYRIYAHLHTVWQINISGLWTACWNIGVNQSPFYMVLEAFWKERAVQKLPMCCCLFASPVINLQQMEGIDFTLEQRLYIIRLCSRSYFLYLFRPDMSLLYARTFVTVVFYLCGRHVPRNGDVHRNGVSSFSLWLYILVERSGGKIQRCIWKNTYFTLAVYYHAGPSGRAV